MANNTPLVKSLSPHFDAWTRSLPPHIRQFRIALYCLAATGFVALASAFLFELWIQTAGHWPESGTFSLAYHLALAGYGIATFLLFWLLQTRHWAEHFRRREASHYRRLFLAAVARDALCAWSFAWAAGPLSPWVLGTMVGASLAAFTLLPRYLASRYVGVLAGGYALLAALAAAAENPALHPMAAVFTALPPSAAPWIFSLAAVPLLASLAVGRTQAGKWTGLSACFSPVAMEEVLRGIVSGQKFEAQLKVELDRARNEIDAVSLLLIEVKAPDAAGRPFPDPSADGPLEMVAQSVLHSIRVEEDTVGLLEGNRVAVLLPEAGSQSAHTVASRIRFEIGRAKQFEEKLRDLPVRIGAASTTWPTGVTVEGLLAAARHSLESATASAEIPIARIVVDEMNQEIAYPENAGGGGLRAK